jgi:hypothetical protein
MAEDIGRNSDPSKEERPQRGPAGDERPNPGGPDPRARLGQPVEDPEDRPGVSRVKPDDYPDKASGNDL